MKRKWLKKTLHILTATLLTASLAACGTTTGSSTATAESSADGTAVQTEAAADSGEASGAYKEVNVAIASEPEFTLPAIGDTLMITNGLLREGLTRYGDGELVDGLAESYEHNEDYTQWTFHLRDSGWSDGTPVTADDWVFEITSLLDGTVELPYPDFLYEIKNARELFTGEVEASELGVTAVNDKTLVFDLAYPVTYFPKLITHPMHFGYSRAFVEKIGAQNVGLEAEYSLSNGPFYIDSWAHDDKIVLKKNPYYWNADNIAIDQVNVYIIPDESTQVNMFLNGELDIVDFSAERKSAVEGAGFEILNYNNGRSVYLQYNLSNEYLSNKYIRQAISSAIDRESLVNGVVRTGTVADGLVPVGLSGDDENTFRDIVGSTLEYTYDSDRAKELLQKGLDELGIEASDVSFTILAKNTDDFISVTGALQQLLQNELGIKVEVETLDSSSVSTKRSNYDYDAVLLSWGADWDDATNFLGGYEHTADSNAALYYSEEFNEAYHTATYTTDITERVKALGEAERILLEDQAITPLYYTNQFYAVSDRLEGVLRRAVVPYLDLYFADVTD